MKPIEFVVFNGDSSPNTPVYKVAEAMNVDIVIRSADCRYEVLSYYFDGRTMVLDIGKQVGKELTPILDLEMTVRTTNLLLRQGMSTIQDILERGSKKLLLIPDFSKKCLREVIEVLEVRGFTLTEDGR